MPLAVWAGLLGATFGVLVILLGAPAELFGRVPPLAGELRATPAQTAVVDGETLVLNETIIRLDGIAAPARLSNGFFHDREGVIDTAAP